MSQGDGNGFIRTRVRCRRCEVGSAEVFMEIGTADTYEGRGDLLIISYRMGRHLETQTTYPDLSRTTLLLLHIFNPDIFFPVVSCCAHAVSLCSVCVPPVR
jgi:hypothetical protein